MAAYIVFGKENLKPYKKLKDPTKQNINNNTITDINQDNIINHLLRSEKMTTRSTNKVLISGGTSSKDNNNLPKSFKQAWDHPEMSERVCWREAIRDEIKTLDDMEVVSVYNRNKMDKHEKTIRSKWVFKVKSDGRYRARLCLFGFQQEEGVNYFLNYSPVVNDITTKVLFMIGTISGNNMRLVDITKAFMERKLNERVYIEIPDGY